MNSLEIQDTVQNRRIYGCFNRSLNTIRLYVVVSFIPDRKWTMQTREDSDGIHSFVRICIDPGGPLRFTFRKSKKIYSQCNCKPICTIYYAEARRHSLHEPFSLAVNLVRNIKPRRVFANHRNKQPLVTSAWRHGKHRYLLQEKNNHAICRLRVGPYSEKLLPRAWKCYPRPAERI